MAPGWASPPAPEGLSLSSPTKTTTTTTTTPAATINTTATTLSSAAAYHRQCQGSAVPEPGPTPSRPPLHPSPSAFSSTDPPLPSAISPPSSDSLVRRKPLPQNVAPVNSPPSHHRSSTISSFPSSDGDDTPAAPSVSVSHGSPSSSHHRLTSPASGAFLSPAGQDGSSAFVPWGQNRFFRGGPSTGPLRIDTSNPYPGAGEDEDGREYSSQFSNGTPVHSRLVSEPFIPVLHSSTPKRATTMGLHPPANSHRPPPLHIAATGRSMSSSVVDAKQPKTPGHKISSFFGFRAASSPGGESSSTEISEAGRSPLHSPMPPSLPSGSYAITPSTTIPFDNRPVPGRNGSLSSAGGLQSASNAHVSELENELREISSELAGSIRREMELEDLVERLQSDMPMDTPSHRRTSDYFSDSGSSSIRYAYDGRADDLEKFRRAAEQERAQLKTDLTQRWQEERARRAATESHIQILEAQVHQLRRERVEISDLSSKTREIEAALDATRRKLGEERQIKDNFEDLLTAMRVELEQIRNERDILRQGGGGGGGASDPAEVQRLLEEIEALKIENASLAQLHGTRFASIAEEEGAPNRRASGLGLSRSSSLARMHSKPNGPSALSRSGSLSRSNSVSGKERDTRDLAERVEDIEAQRNALHEALRRLVDRQAHEARQYEKRSRAMELELARAQQSGSPRRLGYEREVRNLREEVNHLRGRAEDALNQKWQCEKGLGGLKMDLDRAEQETASLRVLLQEHDINLPAELDGEREGFAAVTATSSSLESAYAQLQADREQAEASMAQSPQDASSPLAASLSRTDDLARHVQKQLATNSSLRSRLAEAIGKGEQDQQLSASRINEMQARLKELEDTLLLAQQYSEDEMARHEEEIRQLEETHSAQLMRMKNGARSPMAGLSPIPPHSPFGARSPRLDKTTSGDGMPLERAVQAETLERRVKELEKLLRDADVEMSEVVGRMNRAQIDVAELQSDRDYALRQTRRLQAEIEAERKAFQALMGSN
ncbi:hypothetical protein BDW42DRAFT_200819 [Aspergillus taichungensis]|uniref:DUF7603 domain-containing protein n=1 Tax=Aspergillus taichungensis TaxID=482145 RepID=A0A2J5HVP6_9EURO|nr:hypothetical protein BDW42DRAFT_200819 [Aspergillus taichungensis]